MSLKALTWVMERAPVDDPTSLLILYALADRAHDDGTAAWPSQEWIAKRARCSDRTVRRVLGKLEALGVIQKGDPRHVAHIREDRRPTVWNLSLWMGREDENERVDKMTARTPVTGRPDTGDATTGHPGPNGRTQLCPTNRPEPSLNRPEPLSSTDVEPGSFDEFWKIYPRKAGKAKAKESWGTAIVNEIPERIIEAASKFRDEKVGVARQYVAMPSTWLNQERWQDYLEVSIVDRVKEMRITDGEYF